MHAQLKALFFNRNWLTVLHDKTSTPTDLKLTGAGNSLQSIAEKSNQTRPRTTHTACVSMVCQHVVFELSKKREFCKNYLFKTIPQDRQFREAKTFSRPIMMCQPLSLRQCFFVSLIPLPIGPGSIYGDRGTNHKNNILIVVTCHRCNLFPNTGHPGWNIF